MHVGTPDLLFTCMVHPEREFGSVASWMPRRSHTSVYAVSSEDDCVCVCVITRHATVRTRGWSLCLSCNRCEMILSDGVCCGG